MKQIGILLAVCLALSWCAGLPAHAADPGDMPPQVHSLDGEALGLTAQQAFIYDCSTGELWVWGDQQARIPPASLAKLFTVELATQYLQPEEIVTAGAELDFVRKGSSIAALQVGSRLSVSRLVEGCLVQSGNDAAYALATAAGRRILKDEKVPAGAAVAIFLWELNRRAVCMGMSQTRFTSPDGFDAPGQYTCPADVLKIALLSLENPLVLRHCGTVKDYVIFDSGEDYIWSSTNLLLYEQLPYYCPDAFGLKTGTTEDAGCHLVAAFHAPGRDLIIGVFGCPEKTLRFEEALRLYEYIQ